MQAEIISDAGAYVYLGPWALIYSTVHSTGPYLIPNVQVDACSVLTNNIMTSAFRGFGGMQLVVAYEAQMDELALKLGMNPLELRKTNFLNKGDVTASYQEITSEVWLEQCAKAAEFLRVAPETLILRYKTVLSARDSKKSLPPTEAIKRCHFEGIIPQNLTAFRAPFTEPIRRLLSGQTGRRDRRSAVDGPALILA